jgi:hypothetical protein
MFSELQRIFGAEIAEGFFAFFTHCSLGEIYP